MTEAERLAHFRVDKTGWPDGPWMTEPDRVQWTTATGYPGLVVRSRRGHWCGYVGVPPEHALHARGAEAVGFLQVHGGVDYAALCMEDGPICHIPEPGEPDNVWWFGFHCGHTADFQPGELAFPAVFQGAPGPDSFQQYRDLPYTQGEVELLAQELRVVARIGARAVISSVLAKREPDGSYTIAVMWNENCTYGAAVEWEEQ